MNGTLLESALPKLKALTCEAEYKRMEHVLKTNRNGLRTLDGQVYVPMYGFKDVNEYYKAVSVAPIIDNCAVPCMVLNSKDDVCCKPECAFF